MSERIPLNPPDLIGFLLLNHTESNLKFDDPNLILLMIEDKEKFEDAVTYIYAGSDPSAVSKSMTVYKEKDASAYVVAGR